MKIKFTSAGNQLVGNLFLPDAPKEKNPAILFLHGHTGKKENNTQYAEALVKLGYVCLPFDMTGHGESEGDIKPVTLEGLLEDCKVAYDYLAGLANVDKNNISVVGSSMGGYLAPLLAQSRKVSNLVLRAAADYPNDVFDKPVRENGADNPAVLEFRKRTSTGIDSFALEALRAFGGPVLLIESEDDDRVPHPTLLNYANSVTDKSTLTHVVMKGAPHSIREGKFRDEVEHILTTWFAARTIVGAY